MGRSGPDPFVGVQRARVSRYSRRVRWMKILFPIVAAALVGAIFIAGRGDDRGGELLSPQEIATLSAGLRLENPRIAGRTDGGEPFILRALWAEPEGPAPDRIKLERPTGDLTLADGRLVSGEAATGRLIRSEGLMWLEGGVTVETADGYRFETERMRVELGPRDAESLGPVTGEGPAGSIRAERMRIDSGTAGAGEARIVFEERVRVIFIPEAARQEPTPRTPRVIGEE